MKVLVCGGRDFDNRDAVFYHLDKINEKTPVSYIITGCSQGADALAQEWALSRLVPAMKYRADWRTLGKAAGPIRNQKMLDHESPDLVVAFPGGKGTEDMVRRAKVARVNSMRIVDKDWYFDARTNRTER